MCAAETKMRSQKSVNFASWQIRRGRSWLIGAIAVLGIGLFYGAALAHGDEEVLAATPTLEETIRANTWLVVGIGSGLIGLISIITLAAKPKSSRAKWTSFLLIVIPSVVVTFYLASSTIFLNMISVTKGPVHWHAEFRIFACGEELDLVDPKGLSNRIGSPVLHEHGDNWIHVEGVPVTLDEVRLERFFDEIGGELETDHMLYPTVNGAIYVENGNTCPDGSVGELQMFLYRTENGVVTQTKVEDFPNYILAPYAQVPPGDCFILEFGESKERTEHICTQYEVAIEKGELKLE